VQVRLITALSKTDVSDILLVWELDLLRVPTMNT